jgi:hypothetical protein
MIPHTKVNGYPLIPDPPFITRSGLWPNDSIGSTPTPTQFWRESHESRRAIERFGERGSLDVIVSSKFRADPN